MTAPDREGRVIMDALRRVVRALRHSARLTETSLGISAAQLFVLHWPAGVRAGCARRERSGCGPRLARDVRPGDDHHVGVGFAEPPELAPRSEVTRVTATAKGRSHATRA
jgi:hypothetical protein